MRIVSSRRLHQPAGWCSSCTQIHPISRHAHISARECKELSEVVWLSGLYLEQGLKVLLHCRHGHHRTGVAIYLVLRSMVEEPAQCLSMMKEMRPVMHTGLLRKTASRPSSAKPRPFLKDPNFVQE